jgi:ketosteroid isomerase-like protein
MTTERVAKALFHGLATQDFESVRSLFSPHAVQNIYALRRECPVSGRFEGAEAIRAALARAGEAWSLRRLDLDELVVDGTRAAMHLSIDAVDTQGQRPVHSEAAYFLTVVDGRITELDVYCGDGPVTKAPTHSPEPVDALTPVLRPA